MARSERGGLGRAVVIGAGVAGLAAARVLSDRFEHVTVVDRDVLPDGPNPRRGVPQGAHAHALLAVGREALETIFPGVTEELVGRGARPVDVGRDVLIWQQDGFRVRAESGVNVISLSRPLLEFTLYQRLRSCPNVEIRSDATVTGLTGRDLVDGVSLSNGPLSNGPLSNGPLSADPVSADPVSADLLSADLLSADLLSADLVVDASGRGSRSDRWLGALGFPVPAESSVTVRVGYTTRLVRRRPGELGGDSIVLLAESPPDHKRFGVVFAVEDDRWLVTLGGFHGDHCPTDPDGYQRFAETLPGTAIADLLRRAEPLTDPVAYQYPASRRRHFERLSRVPSGYVAVGDALCSFNPVYGHGMTVAAVEALALGECLDRHGTTGAPMVHDFYRRVTKTVTLAWDMATTADFAYRETVGRRPPGLVLAGWYLRRVILATHSSPEALRAVLRVQHLLSPGSTLFRPAMVATVLRASRVASRVKVPR